MTWLAPWALVGGGLGLLGVLAAHLLTRQRPRALSLATARFLPAGVLEATTIRRTPSDRWWLLLRMLMLALLAAGLAQPVLEPRRVPVRTVLLLDRTLPDSVQRRARSTLASDDAVIVFDSAAVLRTAADTAMVVASSDASLSAALARLLRSRDSLARGADLLRVRVVSSFAARTIDPATPVLRALLPDSIDVTAVALESAAPAPRGRLVARASGDDAIAATSVLLGDSVAPAGTVIVRDGELTAFDSAAALGGATIVYWPAAQTDSAMPMSAITIDRATWIAPIRASRATPVPPGAVPVGHWSDGTAAVWRETRGRGCVLHVRTLLPSAGDQTLSLAAQGLGAGIGHALRAPGRACRRRRAGVARGPGHRCRCDKRHNAWVRRRRSRRGWWAPVWR